MSGSWHQVAKKKLGAPIYLSCLIFFSFSNSEFGREWGVQGETLTFRRKLQKQKERVEPATLINVLH